MANQQNKNSENIVEVKQEIVDDKKPVEKPPTEKENVIPESDKTYRLNQQFRQFKEIKEFGSLGEMWRIEWLGGNEPKCHIAFNLLNGNGGFGEVATVEKARSIPAGVVAKLAHLDSVEKFEETFKPID